jgi:hypothetical protein
MNVETGTETPKFLFWEYLFRNFGIWSFKCIQEFPRPSIIKELQAILGMVNFFYRIFLPRITRMLQPLMDELCFSSKRLEQEERSVAMEVHFHSS